jgi:hypothetical protein
MKDTYTISLRETGDGEEPWECAKCGWGIDDILDDLKEHEEHHKNLKEFAARRPRVKAKK